MSPTQQVTRRGRAREHPRLGAWKTRALGSSRGHSGWREGGKAPKPPTALEPHCLQLLAAVCRLSRPGRARGAPRCLRAPRAPRFGPFGQQRLRDGMGPGIRGAEGRSHLLAPGAGPRGCPGLGAGVAQPRAAQSQQRQRPAPGCAGPWPRPVPHAWRDVRGGPVGAIGAALLAASLAPTEA